MTSDKELFDRCFHLFGFERLTEITGRTERQLRRYQSGEELTEDVTRHLQNELEKYHNSQLRPLPANKTFRFIDLFAGIGGIRKGFEQIGGECVFTSEWDKYARITYQANYPGDKHPLAGDITKVAKYMEDIPAHDVLLAGFPCQPFSIAGVSKKNSLGRNHGFDCDTQGTLFFEIEKIIQEKQPVAFLLENVKNLKSHDKGRTFKVIEKTLTEKLDPGYNIYPMVVDAKGVVPQHRERIFIVGFRKDIDTPMFSFEEDWKTLLDKWPQPDAVRLGDILHDYKGGQASVDVSMKKGFCSDSSTVNEKYTLTEKLWEYLYAYAAKHKAKGNGFGYGMNTPESTTRTLSARYYKDGSEILISQGKNKRPRRLTPRECARLMGYDDNFIIPVSDTQAYKQFGNSVVAKVVERIAENMHPHIERLVAENDKERQVQTG